MYGPQFICSSVHQSQGESHSVGLEAPARGNDVSLTTCLVVCYLSYQ